MSGWRPRLCSLPPGSRMWPHWTWLGGRENHIGIGIASYINLLDPEKIVLAGGMSNESLLIEQIQKVVKIRRMRFAGRRVKLRVSNLGEYGTAIGAAAIQLKTLLRQGGLSLTKEQEEAV